MIRNENDLKFYLINKAFFNNYLDTIETRHYAKEVEEQERDVTKKVIARIEQEINQYRKDLTER